MIDVWPCIVGGPVPVGALVTWKKKYTITLDIYIYRQFLYIYS